MEYKQIDDKLLLYDVKDFDIEEILECGQCFRFEKIGDKYYNIVAMDRVINIKQTPDFIEFFPCNKEDFENIWYDYFDFGTDYSIIKEKINNDIIMNEAINFGKGIRILNQNPFECLLSFIISQNNNIPRIKGIIFNMSKTYGKCCDGNYLFPTLEELKNADIDSLYELKMGFRAKYIYDAIQKLITKEVDLSIINSLSTDDLLKMLLKIKGVGQKVADCTMMFSMNRREVFPTDVWVKRVMEYLYFDKKDTDIKTIHSFAKDKWGDYAGYAQQYLFYYARSLKIGSEKNK